MPVKSRAQQAFLAIHHPDILHKWAREYGIRQGLPKRVRKKRSVRKKK